jgi:hypothetical protein
MLEGDKLIEQERVNVTLVGGITELSFIYEWRLSTVWTSVFQIMVCRQLVVRSGPPDGPKYSPIEYHMPTTVAARSKASTVFPCSNAGIVGSKPTQGMNVCLRLYCVCVGSSLATGWSPVQGVLSTVLGSRTKVKQSVSRMP